MASAAHQVAIAAPAAQPGLSDELLEEIFLRLDAASDLARASAACTTFHRVISARRFLRRFRSLHPPPILGFLEFDQPGPFHPADPPHRSAPAARALARAADFSFSFIPNPTLNSWNVCDARDGRVLLYRRPSRYFISFADLVVCDPLHRRYVQLPPIPDGLAVSTGARGMPDFDPFFDPASKEEKHKEGEEEDLSFGVICVVQCQHKLVTFHFSSVTGKWHALMFNRVLSLATTYTYSGVFERHYAHGCFYWTIYGSSSMFMQDKREMRLSRVGIPTVTYCQQKAVVEAGKRKLGLLTLGGCVLHLYSKTLQNICIGTEEWHQDRTIPFAQAGL
ncbi:unnamed protein product [Urochloa humidicola]